MAAAAATTAQNTNVEGISDGVGGAGVSANKIDNSEQY